MELVIKTKKVIPSLKKIFCSKWIVIMTIIGIWFAGSAIKSADAASSYKFGQVYQYYLLYNQANTMKEGNKEQKFIGMGSIGSGGAQGKFSYDDIVNSASDDEKQIAKQFSSMMATYSTFNYIGNRVEGFSSILSYFGRGMIGLVIFPLSILQDVLSLFMTVIVSFLAKYNVIPLLGSVVGKLPIVSDLAGVIGIPKEKIIAVSNALLSFAVCMILISLALTFKNGGTNIDKRASSKLKGRIFTFVALPVFVTGAAYIVQETYQLTTGKLDVDNSFSRYMVDVRSWAYNFNFTPLGYDSSGTDISPSGKSSYVDLKFNPYTSTGAERIKEINKYSSLVGDGSGSKLFPNTSLVLSYSISQAFSAIDFIDYKGSEASQNYYGTNTGDGNTIGSYYQYAKNMKDNLVDVSKGYYGSGSQAADISPEGSFKNGVDDYGQKDAGSDKYKLIVDPSIAWRDRFIYGAKSGGDNIDKYYAKAPSEEQIYSGVGTDKAYGITNQSMFLVLSTIFDETGGSYHLTVPTRGAQQTVAIFDSSRSNYFVVSMVGSPFFTLFGLIGQPILQIVVLMATLTAVFSLGLVEMNARPLGAYLKGLTLGDFEYPQAFIIYAIGIAGTILMLLGIPSLIINTLSGISKAGVAGVMDVASWADIGATTPQSSLALYGMPLILQFFVAGFFAFLYIKSPSFRHKFIDLFTLPWSWAKATGMRFEEQAGGITARRMERERREMRDRNPINRSLEESNRSGYGIMDSFKKLGEDVGTDIIPQKNKYIPKSEREKNDDLDDSTSNENTGNSTYDADQLIQKGQIARANRSLQENELDPDLSKDQAQENSRIREKLKDLEEEPTLNKVSDVRNDLYHLRDDMENNGASQDQIERVDDAIDNVEALEKELGGDIPNEETHTDENTIPHAQDTSGKDTLSDDGKDDRTRNIDKLPNDDLVREISDEEIEEPVVNNDDEREIYPNSRVSPSLPSSPFTTTIDTITNENSGEDSEIGVLDGSETDNNIDDVKHQYVSDEGEADETKRMIRSIGLTGLNNRMEVESLRHQNTQTMEEREHQTSVKHTVFVDNQDTISHTSNGIQENRVEFNNGNWNRGYAKEQLESLYDGLGIAKDNEAVVKAITSLKASRTPEEFKEKTPLLRDAFRKLSYEESVSIDQMKSQQSLENMLKYIQQNTKTETNREGLDE